MVITPIDVVAVGLSAIVIVAFYANHAVSKIRESKKLEIVKLQ